MQDDIDLGRYVRVLFRHYRIGLLLFMLVAGGVLAASLLRSETYTATTTLFAQAPQYQWRYDQRILPYVETNKNWQKEFTELSKDAGLRQMIDESLKQAGQKPAGEVTVRAGRQTLIYVDAEAETPSAAAELANRWSDAYILWVDKMYGTAALLEPFEEELKQADAAYQEAESRLDEFKSRTGVGIASEGQTMLEGYEWLGPKGMELAEKNRLLAEQRQAVSNLTLLEGRCQEAIDADSSVLNLPWQLLEIPSIRSRGQLTAETVIDTQDEPEALLSLLRAERSAQEEGVRLLEEQAAAMQTELSDLSSQLDLLVQERTLTKDNYQTMRRKVDEIRVQSQVEGISLRLIDAAQPPATPTAASWPLLALAALLGGVAAGVTGCYLAEWLSSPKRRA